MPLLRAIKCATIARERFPRADSAGSVRSLNCLGLLFRPSLALHAFLPFPPCAVLPRLHLSSSPLQNSHSTAISLFPVSVSSASALLFTIGVFLRQNFSGRAHAFFSSVFFGLFLHRSFGKLKRRYPCRRQGCL